LEQVNKINDLGHFELEQKLEQVKNNFTITLVDFWWSPKAFDTCSPKKKGNMSSLLVKHKPLFTYAEVRSPRLPCVPQVSGIAQSSPK
jgi:hypothetical protein